MATTEETETSSITLLITEATGAHFRLPASPANTVGHVEAADLAALSVASGGRPANSVRLVFENTKLHDDGTTLEDQGRQGGAQPGAAGSGGRGAAPQ